MIAGKRVIGIVGSRRRNTAADLEILKQAFLAEYKEGDIICSGGCYTGADKFAKDMAAVGKLPYLEFPADWERFGAGAGMIRNRDIAKASDVLIAMVVAESTAKGGTYKSGTENTIGHFKDFMANDEKRKLIIL